MNRECHKGKQAFILAPLHAMDSTPARELSPKTLDKLSPRSSKFSASL